MEIAPSILSQLVYGEKGNNAIPLSFYMKPDKKGQSGGKKHIEHLGVPLVFALVNVNIVHETPRENTMLYELHHIPTTYSAIEEIAPSENSNYENILLENEPELHSSQKYSPISDEIYNRLLNSLLDEPISQSSLPYKNQPVKKYTRKTR